MARTSVTVYLFSANVTLTFCLKVLNFFGIYRFVVVVYIIWRLCVFLSSWFVDW